MLSPTKDRSYELVFLPRHGVRLEVEHDYAERRKRQRQRVRLAVALYHVGLHAPRVAHAAASVNRRIAVEYLLPEPAARLIRKVDILQDVGDCQPVQR